MMSISQPPRDNVSNINRRIDVLIRNLSILMGCDALEKDTGMECAVRFRHEHMEFLRILKASDEAIKWAIRCAIAIICAAAAWIAVNVTTIITLVENSRH